jgi:hypothetical protein
MNDIEFCKEGIYKEMLLNKISRILNEKEYFNEKELKVW